MGHSGPSHPPATLHSVSLGGDTSQLKDVAAPGIAVTVCAIPGAIPTCPVPRAPVAVLCHTCGCHFLK